MSNSNPGLIYGQMPSAGQWNSFFAAKQDWSAILDAIIAQGGAPSFVAPVSWAPTDGSGAGLIFSGISGEYAVVGNIVLLSATLTYPSTADTSAAVLAGLPYTLPSAGYAIAPDLVYVPGAAFCGIVTVPNTKTAGIYSLSTGTAVENVTLSGKTISFQLAYPLS